MFRERSVRHLTAQGYLESLLLILGTVRLGDPAVAHWPNGRFASTVLFPQTHTAHVWRRDCLCLDI